MTDSKLEARLSSDKPNAEQADDRMAKPKIKSALEESLDDEDRALAGELARSRAEETIARRRLAVRQMMTQAEEQRGEKPRVSPSEEKSVSDIAESLLAKGLDAKVVAEIIKPLLYPGTTAVNALGMAGGTNQGLTVNDIKQIFEMGRDSNRVGDELKEALVKLTEAVTSSRVSQAAPKDPATSAREQVEAVTGLVGALAKAGMVRLPSDETPASGEPIEVVKEKNRHAEEMQKIELDKWHKEQMVNIMSSIPLEVGRGISGDMSAMPPTRPAPRVVTAPDGQFKECEVCHTPIPIPPGATTIVCPNDKCKTVYNK